MADILHYDRMTVAEIRDQALALEIPIREIAEP
jgi:hypothetical protein